MQQNKDGVQKLFKQFGLFSLTIVLSSSLLSAASFEDFKRSQAESFNKYKDEKDAAFNKFLEAQWRAYNAQKGSELYKEPKPTTLPKAQPEKAKIVGPKVNIVVPQISQKPKTKPVIVTKELPKVIEKPIVIKKADISFDFFGSLVNFNISKGIKDANFYPRSKKGISNYFSKVATSEHEALLTDIQNVKKELELNDWGLYLLVQELSKKVYKNDDNSKLLAWFIFNKLGYAVKVGLANKHVVLLHYSDKIIYSTPNYKFGSNKFYVVSNYAKGRVGRLFSYEQNYPGSDKPLDLSLKKLPKFVQKTKTKELSFDDSGSEFKVSIDYNQNILDFMATYPQADYDTFFNAPMQDDTFNQLAQAIKKRIDGKKMSEGLNFVLHFVQKSFKYEKDDAQFGREKVMFAQETIYFDKSDCEDRAVLFSRLVDKLFGVGVVGIKYSDHMATGLYIPMEGDSVRAGSRRFVIADPTFINSIVGQSMPKYKPKKPDSFIVVKR